MIKVFIYILFSWMMTTMHLLVVIFMQCYKCAVRKSHPTFGVGSEIARKESFRLSNSVYQDILVSLSRLNRLDTDVEKIFWTALYHIDERYPRSYIHVDS